MLGALSMAKPAAAFFAGNWKIIAVVIAALVLYIYVDHLQDTIVNQQETINNIERDRDTIKTALEEQNEEIVYWTNIGRKQAAEMEALQQKLVEARKAREQEITEILAGDTPKNCTESIDYLRDTESLKW
jgi:peptidoglycan hydrolase CwlO-like protein